MVSKEKPAVSSVLTSRRRRAGGVAVGAAVLSVLSFGVGQLIKSPAQAVADSSAPPPSVLTAPVEHRVLEASVMLRGTVTAGQSVDVTPMGGGGDAASSVITKQPVAAGQSVRAGQLLLEVSGRPVFALQGKMPAYRDLKPGAEGTDVAQLQSALGQLGYRVNGDHEGHFGPGTKTALAAFYKSLGYDTRSAEPEGDAGVTQAREAALTAQRVLEDAQDAVAAARDGRPAGAHGSGAPASGTAEGTGAGTGQSLSELQKQADRAREDLDKAGERLAKAEEIAGPMLPASEVVFLSRFPARVAGVDTKVGSAVTGKAMTLSAGALTVQGYLQTYEKGLVHPGQRVEIFSELTGQSAVATVSTVSDQVSGKQPPAQDDRSERQTAGDEGYLVVVKPVEPLPSSMADQDVRLTVRAATTKGKALVVPVSAISAGADGRTAVTVRSRNGSQHRVTVTTGTSGDGYVEVRPQNQDRLRPGDHVLTGVRGTYDTARGAK
ncbi:putative peptidoglycan binding protein [Streptomyces sp. KhCrAH-43]|uniref:peptidoglycan-binding protein n=1 Tax=Streptomyces sp. KhCrAH-43 TaxID=1305827 RepID=UPI0004B6B061|nr:MULTISPECIES: peptidoglycan-binding protein [unclassified Streptomyces]RAJ64761.1 putative peptidoglycan binding protein [Streptomyces sp. KhCrAH-43]